MNTALVGLLLLSSCAGAGAEVWKTNDVRPAPGAVELSTPSNDECAGATRLYCNTTVNIDLTGATTNPADPEFTCRNGASAQGVATVWYYFVAGAPDTSGPSTTTLKTGPLSGGSASNTLLAVYTGSCGSLVQVGCNDDVDLPGGNLYSELTIGLSPGRLYYVQVAASSEASVGMYTLQLNCRVPLNDTPCPNIVTANDCNGFSRADLSAATIGPDEPIFGCRVGGAGQGYGSVWFSFRPSGTSARLSTEMFTGGVANDTLLAVYSGGICGNFVEIACNDDIDTGGGNYLSAVSLTGLSTNVSYRVRLAAKNPENLGSYGLIVECPDHCISCPTGAYVELEPCGGDTNGGCNVFPTHVFEPIPCGATYCGTGWYNGLLRDTDWLGFSLSVPSTVSWCVTSQFRHQIAIASQACAVYGIQYGDGCGQSCVSATLPPGVYALFVAKELSSPLVSCGDLSPWTGAMTVTPLCRGDCNNDNTVNTADLTQVLSDFGQPVPTCSPADSDQNGIITTADLTVVLGHFGTSCPTANYTPARAVDPALFGIALDRAMAPVSVPAR